ncbi:NAD(P)/FAD-dependent oxidoreductase [Fusobacterium mortiferum]|uniref:NAD(FAD)-utilizing dehydrogenase n=1 Tax=Fusobacterium mortiferum ATCC 9817 TaxID=469616 RepID=A0ABN5JAU9_FUSMR|nr:FAD-dependent oxidoreductase [Fusobacterium mortiferum]AVQ19344.1 NAD(FAD)-utilizing dehydrogenase [Fusobacterium mortiferum ATCC 9817]EEO36246.1 pyridine nucleotide-disulfide oxidoreductase [Fusobacterium mortiferum ATCC 9817]
MRINVNNIIVSLERNQDKEIIKEIEKRGVKRNNIKSIIWSKRSIDSRKKSDIKLIYNLEVELETPVDITTLKNISLAKDIEKATREPILSIDKEVAVIGAGPAGLFAALRLAEYGFIPIVFERGEEVDKRDITTENFVKNSILNPNSNIQFGEGGAGTYSDGKLNTRIKSEYMDKIFETLVECGAPSNILWDYKPHVGTDILKIVVKNLREKIKSLGGKFFFNHRLENIHIKNGKISGIDIINSTGEKEYHSFNSVILAIGHSARDTYRMLHKNGVQMESKPFAIGARIEHPRCDIDKMQYGKFADNELLGSATYSVTYNNRAEERGVFSFCMCPGGVIVNASSELNTSLVNGMSYSQRDGRFSNSAIVVGVKENDFGSHLFAGMEFQEKLERKTYELGQGYGALYQGVLDFMNNKKTTYEIESSYEMKKTSYNLNDFFPEVIVDNMKSAFEYWSKNPMFISRNANLIAPETRTSAPVRIIRDIKGMSVNVYGLYPIGEGAGYAGGITSAGVDGVKIVDLAFTRVKD